MSAKKININLRGNSAGKLIFQRRTGPDPNGPSAALQEVNSLIVPTPTDSNTYASCAIMAPQKTKKKKRCC